MGPNTEHPPKMHNETVTFCAAGVQAHGARPNAKARTRRGNGVERANNAFAASTTSRCTATMRATASCAYEMPRVCARARCPVCHCAVAACAGIHQVRGARCGGARSGGVAWHTALAVGVLHL